MELNWNEYRRTAREVIAEGIVMLENNGALPLKKGERVAVFGRMQLHYYKSGTGSGGNVHAYKVFGITDGLLEQGKVCVDEKLLDTYRRWDEENPVIMASGWGGEPWSQAEMPLSDDTAADAASRCESALCVIARTAGEEQENAKERGSWYLTEGEEQMLAVVRAHFKKMTVLLNVGNIIDMGFVKKYSPDAVLYVWHGGMEGGLGTADVLTGISPSGKLPDTIPVTIEDHPADSCFYGDDYDIYKEDIYVGYRYFETFAPDKVLYPFGYGMSYSVFDLRDPRVTFDDKGASAQIKVVNTGDVPAKEVVQFYISPPCGVLGNPARRLAAFEKTRTLSPGEEQIISAYIPREDMASFDDSGKTGFADSWVMEKGTYTLFIGTDVRSAKPCGEYTLDETLLIRSESEALAPVTPFERMYSDNGRLSYEPVPVLRISEEKRREENIPASMPITGDRGIKLSDVRQGKASMEDFVAQLDEDLLCQLVRGEGMCSPKVTAGTASAFGGLSDELTHYGIPAACTADGPSGLRFDSGAQAFSMPQAALQAATFNKELVEKLYSFTGLELAANKVESLLGPGMNIHRHPLCGRNFEYFSEDPVLTGEMAAAQLKGLHRWGVTGTIKHFCANNQEHHRHTLDSIVSKRALREIYLKGFEYAVKKGGAKSVMTTYGRVNGLYTAGNYDLISTILRREWGFEGIVMTDWWADINRRGQDSHGTDDLAAMVRAGGDVYMVTGNAATNRDTLADSLASGYLTLGELQQSAKRLLSFIMDSHAMERAMGTVDTYTIANRPENSETAPEDIPVYEMGDHLCITPDFKPVAGSSHYINVDIGDSPVRKHTMSITAVAEGGPLAQVPLTFYYLNSPCHTFVWNGTDGKEVTMTADFYIFSRFSIIKFYFGSAGLDIKKIEIYPAEE